MNARHRHLVVELDLARAHEARRPARPTRGSGVAASGMCPSPANSPEVGSRPTQPAPGRYTSAQACRSVKSCAGPGGAVERLLVGPQLNQVARDEARGQPEVAQRFHQQPRRVAARAAAAASASPRSSARPAPSGSGSGRRPAAGGSDRPGSRSSGPARAESTPGTPAAAARPAPTSRNGASSRRCSSS